MPGRTEPRSAPAFHSGLAASAATHCLPRLCPGLIPRFRQKRPGLEGRDGIPPTAGHHHRCPWPPRSALWSPTGCQALSPTPGVLRLCFSRMPPGCQSPGPLFRAQVTHLATRALGSRSWASGPLVIWLLLPRAWAQRTSENRCPAQGTSCGGRTPPHLCSCPLGMCTVTVQLGPGPRCPAGSPPPQHCTHGARHAQVLSTCGPLWLTATPRGRHQPCSQMKLLSPRRLLVGAGAFHRPHPTHTPPPAPTPPLSPLQCRLREHLPREAAEVPPPSRGTVTASDTGACSHHHTVGPACDAHRLPQPS